jgi:hypothetical protein
MAFLEERRADAPTRPANDRLALKRALAELDAAEAELAKCTASLVACGRFIDQWDSDIAKADEAAANHAKANADKISQGETPEYNEFLQQVRAKALAARADIVESQRHLKADEQAATAAVARATRKADAQIEAVFTAHIVAKASELSRLWDRVWPLFDLIASAAETRFPRPSNLPTNAGDPFAEQRSNMLVPISLPPNIVTLVGEGSAGVGFQDAQGNTVTADQMSKKTQFEVRGGDSTLASNPQQWPNTVKPAREWAVIGRGKLKSILDWLPEEGPDYLRSRVKTLWPKLPLPPAVWDLEDFKYDPIVQDRYDLAKRAQFVLGSRFVTEARDGALGAVQLICGTDLTPELGRGDAAGGAASFHSHHTRDIWIDTASVCLPVPAGHHYAATTSNTSGKAPTRFAIAETNLTFDKWHLLENPAHPNVRGFAAAPTDGFVFCSLEAIGDGDGGYITCAVDKVIIAAASAHRYSRSNESIRYASFCAPYAKGSHVEVVAQATSGPQYLSFKVWQIPCTSQGWRFKKPELFRLGANVKAETDGFLNGVVTAPQDGPRGILRLECAKDRTSFASAAVHVYHPHDRYISHSSAMMPVGKGSQMNANLIPFSGAPLPQAQVYWTGVVPVIDLSALPGWGGPD